eukprot:2592254-Rhodomonas_salina.1
MGRWSCEPASRRRGVGYNSMVMCNGRCATAGCLCNGWRRAARTLSHRVLRGHVAAACAGRICYQPPLGLEYSDQGSRSESAALSLGAPKRPTRFGTWTHAY